MLIHIRIIEMKIIAVITLLVGLCFSSSNGRSLNIHECPFGEDEWNPSPCVHCTCRDGVAQCFVQDCAAPDCDNYIVPEGKCCPVCPPNGCNPTGEIFRNNYNVLSWRPDPCTHCSCVNGQSRCVIQDCAAPSCSDYVVPPGQCCPICPNGPDFGLVDHPNNPDVQGPQVAIP